MSYFSHFANHIRPSHRYSSQFLLSSCHLSSTVWVSCYLAMISSLSHGVPVFVQNCPTQSKLIGCPVRNVSCISYLLEEL